MKRPYDLRQIIQYFFAGSESLDDVRVRPVFAYLLAAEALTLLLANFPISSAKQDQRQDAMVQSSHLPD